MSEAPQIPQSPDEVLDWLEEGKVSPAEAFALFRRLEQKGYSPVKHNQVRSASDSHDDDESARKRRLDKVMEELDSLIGLNSVKELVREVQAFVQIQQRRALMRLATEPLALHMIFKGNPGTGKTTVARVFGRMFEAMGVLPKGHMIECERADLVGEYIGHTAQKTREQVKKAMGGILFVDEAYSLARGGEKDFGKEAIDTLVKAMEDNKDQLVLILAGYSREMEMFLHTNPGLRSRFPIHIDFPDYEVNDLLEIAQLMLRGREYRMTSAARKKLAMMVDKALRGGEPHLGNARYIRNVIERAIRRQAVRLVGEERLTRMDLLLITEMDLEEVTPG